MQEIIWYSLLLFENSYTLNDPPGASRSNTPASFVSGFTLSVVLPQQTGVLGFCGSMGGLCTSLDTTNLVSLSPLIYLLKSDNDIDLPRNKIEI